MTKGQAIAQARKLWPKEQAQVYITDAGERRVGYVHRMGSFAMFMVVGSGDSWQAAVDAAKAEVKRIEEFDYDKA